jgi:hypothetical protein
MTEKKKPATKPAKRPWIDTTSYSRGESREGVEPQKWTLAVGDSMETFIIVVHHYLGCGDQWFASCHAVNLSQHVLSSRGVEDAKIEAVSLVYRRLLRWLSLVEKVR